MRYVYILKIAVFLFFSSNSFGQGGIGVRVGGLVSDFSGINHTTSALGINSSVQAEPNSGLAISAYYYAPILGQVFGFQPEVGFRQLGSKIRYNTLGLLGEEDFSINYVTLLAPLRLGFANEGLRVYGLAGPYAAIGASGDVRRSGRIFGVQSSEERPLNFDRDNLRRSDVGLLFGGGFLVKTGPVWLGADLRSSFGLQDINTDTSRENFNPKNRAFSLGFHLYVPIGS